MTVNVQDFFRPDRYVILEPYSGHIADPRHSLVSQFTMAADSDESLRIASVELQPPTSGYVVDASSRKAGPVVHSSCSKQGPLITRLWRLHNH